LALGERLRALLAERALSLSELARLSDLSKGYLSQLTTGKASNPSVEALGRIAAALGLKTGDLLGEADASSPDLSRLPSGLRAFVEAEAQAGRPLATQEVEMLAGIRYRGRQPATREDWAYLYETIKRVAR